MVMVSLDANGEKGLGYTYADVSAAHFIVISLQKFVVGQEAMNIEKIVSDLHRQIRNNGNCGIAFMALSAIDIALWDLKAKILNLPLVSMLGQANRGIQIYGSGGFISYTDQQIVHQMRNWSDIGIRQMKMKIGRDMERDLQRIKLVRDTIGPENALFVDANGAYSVNEALKMADEFINYRIDWYEEPVSSDNLEGLSFVRENCSKPLNIAAGEYGFGLPYFRKMLEHRSIDILQADATRCGGITGFLKAGYLAEAFHVPFSFHCAPSVHLHVALALPDFYTGEYFFDHTRIEQLFFEGFQVPEKGFLYPDLSREGLGLVFKESDAQEFKIYQSKQQ